MGDGVEAVVENGREYKLKPLSNRKVAFEGQLNGQRNPKSYAGDQVKSKNFSDKTNVHAAEVVKSQNVPYIVDEQEVLRNIKIVKSFKDLFSRLK